MHSSLKVNHEIFMHRCLQLAKLGQGFVAPNPMVGAVLVHNKQIIGEGYHRTYGGPHAEVNCIQNAIANGFENLLNKSTIYVSLEPCAHFGKTPPCAELIINHKLPTVVIGCRDPFVEVDGRGVEKLKQAGISVIEGVLEQEAKDLNKRFFCFHQHHKPFVILKWAQTADGFIGNVGNERLMISNDITNRLVHQWRSQESAILVGTKTALKDNPQLTNRFWHGAHPVRLVTDFNNVLPGSHNIFSGEATTIIFNYDRHTINDRLKFSGLDKKRYWYKLDAQRSSIIEMMEACYRLGIPGILVEGGARLQQSFIDENCWNEARVITNPDILINAGISAPVLKNVESLFHRESGSDRITYFSRSNSMVN